MLVWIDLEMTGLDPQRHVIVEIATLLTDDSLEVIAEGPDLILHASAAELAAMDDAVAEMHAESGLTDLIRESRISAAEATAQTMDFLAAHIAEPGTVPLCGNSIGTDRQFLARHMADIHRFLHYRNVDVSTVKELCRRWHPDVFAKAPEKSKTHRALDDIHESITELRHYRDLFFAAPTTGPAAKPAAGHASKTAAEPDTAPDFGKSGLSA